MIINRDNFSALAWPSKSYKQNITFFFIILYIQITSQLAYPISDNLSTQKQNYHMSLNIQHFWFISGTILSQQIKYLKKMFLVCVCFETRQRNNDRCCQKEIRLRIFLSCFGWVSGCVTITDLCGNHFKKTTTKNFNRELLLFPYLKCMLQHDVNYATKEVIDFAFRLKF